MQRYLEAQSEHMMGREATAVRTSLFGGRGGVCGAEAVGDASGRGRRCTSCISASGSRCCCCSSSPPPALCSTTTTSSAASRSTTWTRSTRPGSCAPTVSTSPTASAARARDAGGGVCLVCVDA
eukprot:356726-Rhodomonas_salina.1